MENHEAIGNSAALVAALAMSRQPSISKLAVRAPLPAGVTYLLEVAAGEPDALRSAITSTRQSEAALRAAAGFYIEQVLFSRRSDSYRVLGGRPDMASADLRRNMALLMRWLHPDVNDAAIQGEARDRQIFINRITLAWEDIKTDERRARYDAGQGAGRASQATFRTAKRPRPPAEGDRRPERQNRTASARRRPGSQGSVVGRILAMFKGQP